MQERVGMVGGEIEIESTPGAGTRIRVRLPLSEAA
jgi:signal transduction histidine kinase